jgi:hypothetical protein
MPRLLVLLPLVLCAACWDGGPLQPQRRYDNPCHPAEYYTLPQDLTHCPVPR